ncbi:MAG: transcriptional regulator [Solirubrobacterales bacterium]
MAQVTLRVDDGLASRLKQVASGRDQSVNAFATAVLRAAVDPELAGDEAAQLRERLDRAGLLVGWPQRSDPGPDEQAVDDARRRAGSGTQLSSLVTEGRR